MFNSFNFFLIAQPTVGQEKNSVVDA